MCIRQLNPAYHTALEGMPKLVFFRPVLDTLPKFIRGHLDDQERCLRQFFNLTVIHEDADYDAVLNKVQPDLALFESGVYVRRDRSIRNTHRHPEIPKLGLLNADAYCLTRSVFLADMNDWGVDTFFTIGMATLDHTPELSSCLYVWPNFADRTLFRNYSHHRNVPILLTGSRQTHYPWRVRVDRVLRERFEVSSHAHGEWFDPAATSGMPSGLSYAHDLASALIVPTCGTIAHELVRKHFEIPGCGALLLTERTSAVVSAGFVDGVNCVFADEADAADKVKFLLDHSDQLKRISSAGQALVHNRHSIEHRNQIRQWFDLWRLRQPGQTIRQPDPFGALVLDTANQTQYKFDKVSRTAVDLTALDNAQKLMDENEAWLASKSFVSLLNCHFAPEPAFGLAQAQLRLGSLESARQLLLYSVRSVTDLYGASLPDPVEWAWLIRVTLCAGDRHEAIRLSLRYPTLSHSELDRMRSVVAILFEASVPMPCRPRLSVHVRTVCWKEWQRGLARDLSDYGHHSFANTVLTAAEPVRKEVHATPIVTGTPRRFLPRVVRSVIRRLIDFIHHEKAVPRPQSLFQLLSGEDFDVVLLLGISHSIARRVDAAVANDPRPLSGIRAGVSAPLLQEHFVPWGLGDGVGQPLLSRLQTLGRLLIIADESAIDIFAALDISNAVFVILGVHRDLPMWVGDNSWLEASKEGLAEALGTPALRVLRKGPVVQR